MKRYLIMLTNQNDNLLHIPTMYSNGDFFMGSVWISKIIVRQGDFLYF